MTDYIISEEQLRMLKGVEMFTTTEIRKQIRSRSLSEELKKERERVIDAAIMEYDKLSMEGWSAWKFKEVLESLRGEP